VSTWTAGTVPSAEVVIFGGMWLASALPPVIGNVLDVVHDLRRRRDDPQHLNDVFAAYGLVYRRPVSPPSHVAGRAT
jgi:hypothetical protein